MAQDSVQTVPRLSIGQVHDLIDDLALKHRQIRLASRGITFDGLGPDSEDGRALEALSWEARGILERIRAAL